MQAEIIAVGSELLTPSKVDTNSLFLSRKLAERGVRLARKSVIGDDRELLATEIRRARSASDLVILTGGLGPTLDDLTRDAASDATGKALVRHERIVRDIEAIFRRFNRPMASVNERQAWVLDGARILPNSRGTAPGQWLEDGQGILALLPGPPRELKPLFAESCLPLLDRHLQAERFHTRCLRVAGIGESDLEQRIGPIYSGAAGIETTILSSPGDIQIHLTASGSSAAAARSAASSLGDEIQRELGDAIYSTDGRPLEEAVARHLRRRGIRVAAAESCTGGLLAAQLTAVPGSSECFAGGFVSYSPGAKAGWLGLAPELLETAGVVSAPVASAMAAAARDRAAAALGLPAMGVSTTGTAGPGGGTERNPVGTVYFGIADEAGSAACRRQLGRGRNRVRQLAVQIALDLLRRRILGLPISGLVPG